MFDFGGALFNQLLQMVFITALLRQQMVMSQCAGHRRFNMPKVQRLGYVIKRACTHGFDSKVDGLLPANHHHYSVGSFLQNPWDQIESANPAHVYVTYDQVEVDAVEDRQRLLCRAHRGAIVIWA